MAILTIKTSQVTATPVSLAFGELAYSELSDKLFIGDSGNNPVEVGGAGEFSSLASPAFTGTPTAPTPTQGDNSTTLATTAYVDTALLSVDTLGEMTDTNISAEAGGHILVYDGVNSWDNRPMGGDATLASNGVLTLQASGVTPGTYTKITVDTKGRATTGTTLSASDIPALLASKITDFDTQVQTNQLDEMAAPTTDVDFNSVKITGLGTPTLGTDAATKQYVDDRILTEDTFAELNDTNIASPMSGQIPIYDGTDSWDNKTISGDATLSSSGGLTLNNVATAGTHTKITFNAKGLVTSGGSLLESDIPTLTSSKISDFDTQVRTSRLDQMAAPTATLSMNNQVINFLGAPTSDLHAATKKYVDDIVGAISSPALAGDGLDKTGDTFSVDVTDIIDTTKGLSETSNNIEVNISSDFIFTAGAIELADVATGATATKVTFNDKGLVTSSSSLVAGDIPILTSSKISDFDTQVRTSRLDQMAAPAVDLSMNLKKLTALATPTANSDAATKQYVDTQIALTVNASDYKDSVRVGSTANVTIGGDTQGAAWAVDGVTVADGDRILLKDQSSLPENGIYTIALSTSVITNDTATFTRATDFDEDDEVTANAVVFVEEGTTLQDTGWTVTVADPIVVGTDDITWTEFTDTDVIAGDGLDKTVNTLSVDVTDIIDTNKGLGETSNNIEVKIDTQSFQFDGSGVIELKPQVAGTGLALTSGVLSVNVDTNSFTTSGDQINLAAGVAGNGLNISSGVLGVNVSSDLEIVTDTVGLKDTTITPGQYTKVTFDAKGRATAGTTLVAGDIPTLTSAKISDFDTQVRTSRLDQMAVPTSSLDLNSQKIIGLATPTLGTDAATKQYVDDAVLTVNTIDELTDTDITAPSGGHIMIYDGTDTWDNQPISGDITLSSGGVTTLATVATPGTHTKVTFNAKGLVTSGGSLIASDIPTLTASKISDFDTQVRTSRVDQMAVALANVDINTNRIINVVNPIDAQDVATKHYVDSQTSGREGKDSCLVATDSDVTLAGDTQGSNYTIDGIVLVTGNRVLVKSQTDTTENGIYTVVISTSVVTNDTATYTRATDFDDDAEVTPNTFCFVEQGTTHKDSGWMVSSNNPITVGSVPIVWIKFTALGQIVAGDGLTKTGDTLSLDYDVNSFTIVSEELALAANVAGDGLALASGQLSVDVIDGGNYV